MIGNGSRKFRFHHFDICKFPLDSVSFLATLKSPKITPRRFMIISTSTQITLKPAQFQFQVDFGNKSPTLLSSFCHLKLMRQWLAGFFLINFTWCDVSRWALRRAYLSRAPNKHQSFIEHFIKSVESFGLSIPIRLAHDNAVSVRRTTSLKVN